MSGAMDLQQLLTGLTQLARSRPDLAMQQAEALLRQFPRLVPVHCLAAHLARRCGDLERAERHLDSALAEDPEAPPAVFEKGVLAAIRSDYREAVRCFRWLTENGHGRADPWFNLALAEEQLGHFDQAIAAFREALERGADNAPAVRARLGGALAAAGKDDEARTAIEAALSEDPECVEALLALGMLELSAGSMETALDRFRQCVQVRPDCAEAWQQILESRKLEDANDPDLEAVRGLWARANLPAESRERLGFALAKACDDLGLYDEAFGYLREANSLKHRRLPGFDRDAWARECADRLASARHPAAARSRRNPVTVVPIFVIGLPRSGTTLVDQILTSHPRVAGVGELPFFEGCEDREDGALRADYLDRLADTGAKFVTNKYPANFRHLPLIRRLFPEARVVHVVRHPVDTCLSIFFQDFPTGNLYANDLEDIAAYYRGYRALTEAWAGRGSGVFEVRYESLTADLESNTHRLLAYCGLPWAPECLDFHANPRPVATLSRWQVRQPIYATSAGRWRHYEAHIGPLVEALGSAAP